MSNSRENILNQYIQKKRKHDEMDERVRKGMGSLSNH